MSIDIDAYAYNLKEIKDKIFEVLKVEQTENNSNLVDTIFEKFGYITQDRQEFIIICNEFYDEGNPYYNICKVLCGAFGKSENKVDLFGEAFCRFKGGPERKKIPTYANAYDIADEMNLEYCEDDDDE